MATDEQSCATTTSIEPGNTGLSWTHNARMIQNFHLVWLDGGIDENNDEYRNSIAKLREVVYTVNTFTNAKDCIDFINTIEETVFLISSGELGRTAVPVVHDKPQVSTVYIFDDNKARHEAWIKDWLKINGVYTDVISICETLKQAAKDCNQNAVSISFVKIADETSEETVHELDQCFTYTQIMKDILPTLDFEQSHIDDFITYCREQLIGNTTELKNVQKLQNEYRHHQPIWWYTYESFLHYMLSKPLHTMEVSLIIKMAFFMRDLQKHITELHVEQYGGQSHSDSFIVYRGQGLPRTDFDHLMSAQGELLAFNSFLSTSINRNVSLDFARRTIANSNLMSVLFVMKIDPSISKTPFANITKVSYQEEEEEVILFSMQSIFRIGQIKQIDENNHRLWQVDLTLTSDDDPQLHALSENKQQGTEKLTGWSLLGQLMFTLELYKKAEEFYKILLQQSNDEEKKQYFFHQLALTQDNQGKYQEAIQSNQKSLEIRQKNFPLYHSGIALSYFNIGLIYTRMEEYSTALSYLKKTLRVYRRTRPTIHPDIANTYNSIGAVYYYMKEYLNALLYYEQALEIQLKCLPEDHPDLGISYSNMAILYKNKGENSKALLYYEQLLRVQQKTLSQNHPLLADCYKNISAMYDKMGEFSKAFSSYEKAFEIHKKILPADHPDLAGSYNKIGMLYYQMEDFSTALLHFVESLQIQKKILPADHLDLSDTYNNIGTTCDNTGLSSKALLFFNKTLQIQQKNLPVDHPDFAGTYNNIASVYDRMGEHSKALLFYEKALTIWQKTVSPNDTLLGVCHNNIGAVYRNMDEYPKALECYERALDIFQHSLPPSHPNIKNMKEKIESIKTKL